LEANLYFVGVAMHPTVTHHLVHRVAIFDVFTQFFVYIGTHKMLRISFKHHSL
jgi:hypothetical protein